jgi:ubiquinone/menaquinone biosynthesis C-methylase UbiE
MSGIVCPWWLGSLLAAPVRRLWHDPEVIVAPYVGAGMTVLEPGPGMGYFTLEMARIVGPKGRVVAVDVQPRMVEGLRRRAARAGLLDRIDARLCRRDTMEVEDLAGGVDFVLAFAVVHELPDATRFFAEVARTLKPGGRLLLAEPRLHVSGPDFAATTKAAEPAGLEEQGQPTIRGSRSALLAARAA